MFMLFLGFFMGWVACNWYVENGRSFDRAFGPLASDAREAIGEATRVARRAADGSEDGNGRGTPSAARRTRRA